MPIDDVKSDSLGPVKLLAAFDKGCGSYSKPLLMKNHNVLIPPPNLLPGETLLLQQPKVTCVNTLINVATGALHLTNYRIIFTGKYMESSTYTNEMNAEFLATLGYRYQKHQTLLSKFVNKSKSLRNNRKMKNSRKGLKNIMQRSLSSNNLTRESKFHADSSLPTNAKEEANNTAEEDVVISIPNLCLYEIKKFPKQYLEVEKLIMLKAGIEIITTNYLSIKLCLGDDEGTYEADELIARLLKHSKVKNSSTIFAYVYARGVLLPKSCKVLNNPKASNIYQLEKEIERFTLTSSSQWIVTEQLISNAYPSRVVIPKVCMEPGKLKLWADFHRNGCFPVVVWRNKIQGNVLLRSSQSIAVRGFSETRNIVDEEIINIICSASTTESNALGKTLAIFTDGNTTYTQTPRLSVLEGLTYFYPHCDVITVNLPELSATHQSALKLQALLSKCDDSHFLSGVEETGWLNEISVILDYSLRIVTSLCNKYSSVLLSIGSGLERVAQLSSLAQLIIDPYYRTFDGFQVLIQKEWTCIKHPFVKRNVIDLSCEEELSPIFLQFLDCVWQLCQQYPTTFQFSDQLLELLATHCYSGRFSTFLDNIDSNANVKSISIWSYIDVLALNSDDLSNFNYDMHQNPGVLQPNVSPVHLSVWSWFTNYRKEEHLFVASMFSMMELEKLQKKYQELMVLRYELLQKLSNSDEQYVKEFNSALCYSQSSTYNDIYVSQLEQTKKQAEEPGRLSNKWKSADDLLDYRHDKQEICPGNKSIGKSLFFYSEENGSEVSDLKELRSQSITECNVKDEKYSSLQDYLKSKGLNPANVKEVRISEMTCSGYLVKEGGNFRSWLKRWFVVDLKKKFVAYFKDPLSTEPKGVFNYLSIQSVREESHKKGRFIFEVVTLQRTYHIEAPNDTALKIWMTCLSVPLTRITF